MNKFELLDQIILSINRLADAAGVERCVLLVNVVQMLGALKENLTESDKAAEAREALLAEQLAVLTTPPPTDDESDQLGGNTVMLRFGGDEDAPH